MKANTEKLGERKRIQDSMLYVHEICSLPQSLEILYRSFFQCFVVMVCFVNIYQDGLEKGKQ